MTDYFPSSYEESRARFKQGLSLLQGIWPDARLEAYPLKEHPDLTIDWAWAESQNKENLILISTALHGIEGYVGSAVQYLFMQEYLSRLDPENTSLLLVHAINPWGMKHRHRVNQSNVDLNRNFIFNGKYEPAMNPEYDALIPLLNPDRPVGNLAFENFRFLGKVIYYLIGTGQEKVKAATLLGQHRHPKGIYYGGSQTEEETHVLMELYRYALNGYTNILQVDMHTGYGPRYQMTVLLSSLDSTPSHQAAAQFNYPLVQKVDADEFYAVSGDMIDCLYHLRNAEFPDKKLCSSGFEFGTYGTSIPALLRSLRITIWENQLRQHGAQNKRITDWIREEYDELFYPSEQHWREKALTDARQALEGILSAHELISLSPLP